MDEIIATVRASLTGRGWSGRVTESAGQLIVTDPATGEDCEADSIKEALWASPHHEVRFGPRPRRRPRKRRPVHEPKAASRSAAGKPCAPGTCSLSRV
ncbi:hypothetical protein ACFWXK_38320 [Streptomyces sp. NPDC059070]|uniref:hypothetical protein n=1 Tax=Streptomyces sp. NPDC059070 TaxID=3346713 RepID=UPI0036AC2428